MKNLRCLALAVLAVGVSVDACAAGLKEEMRQPWQRGGTDYLKRWLVTGPIACDLPSDCIGGEANVHPTDGAAQTVAKGDATSWRRTDSWGEGARTKRVPVDKFVKESGPYMFFEPK